MALIQRLDGDPNVRPLAPLQVIGRAPSCRLRDVDGHVSGLHAEVRWDGSRWLVEDLGSRNGTWVDGRRLRPREPMRLQPGSEIAIGRPDNRWVVLTDDPPVAMAEAADGQVLSAVGSLLALPDPDDPEAVVYKSHEGQWVIDTGTGTAPVESAAIVTAGGTSWTLHLPEGIARTVELDDLAPIPRSLELVLEVSADGQQVQASCRIHDRTVSIGPRSSHQLLLMLARARHQDAEDGLHPEDQGWLPQAMVADQLGFVGNALNVAVHRLRRQFEAIGVSESSGVVERRGGIGELRLGIPVVHIYLA